MIGRGDFCVVENEMRTCNTLYSLICLKLTN